MIDFRLGTATASSRIVRCRGLGFAASIFVCKGLATMSSKIQPMKGFSRASLLKITKMCVLRSL